MDFDAYARRAVDLVNTPLDDLAELNRFLTGPEWACEDITERDLHSFRRTQRRLREVFEHGAAGRERDAVVEINALFDTHPVHPRISGHQSGNWHIHVTSRGSSISSEYLASAVWGLAAWLCEYGSARFGVCADERCAHVYLDTSSNNCRRFCSERCATRSHVAAHRARKKAASPESALRDPARQSAAEVVGV